MNLLRLGPICIGWAVLYLLGLPAGFANAEKTAPKKIVLIAGAKSHGPGEHEYEKGVRLLKQCLDESRNLRGYTTEVVTEGWPKDEKVFDGAATILLFSDGSDRHEAAHPLLREERLKKLQKVLDRGVGFVAIHYTVFVPGQRGGQEFLDWLGGYFDYETGPKPRGWYSKIQHCTAQATFPQAKHPICRGLKPFELKEEFYYNMRFPEERSRWAPILSVPIPGEKEPHVVAWAVERANGGRGFGYTGGHFHSNWQIEQVRRMVLNALVWTAHAEVPAGGVESKVPRDPEEVRVLILTGHQHPAHDWRTTTKALKEVLGAESRLKVTVAEDPEFLATKELAEHDVVLLNYVNHERPGLSDRAKANLMQFVEGGKGLVAIHFANGAFRDWPEYRKLVRRVWVDKVSGHDPYGRFVVEVARPDHPITQGMKEFETADELYFKQVGELPIETLLTARSRVTGKQEPMAFVYQQGKGRVFQTVLGHDAAAIRNRGAGELIRRGCIWAAGRELKPVKGVEVKPAKAGTPATLTDGKFGRGLDGRGGAGEARYHEAYQKLPLTVECWARLDSAAGYNLLVANNVKESNTHWEIYSMNGTGTFSAYLPGRKPDVIDSRVKIVDSRWHHLAMVLEAERVRQYVDAKQVAAVALTTTGGTARQGPLWFAGYPPHSLGCDGVVDEVRISQGFRGIDDVPAKPFAADEKTLGLWHFDKVEANKSADESKLKNDAVFGRTASALPRKPGPSSATELDYKPVDPRLEVVLIDRSAEESYVSVKVDSQGQVFVGGREALFVFEPDDKGGYRAKKELYRFPPDSWVSGIEVRGNDLYVLTAAALYLFPEARVKRVGLKPKRLLWGIPLDLHVSFHCLAWGPEGDLYLNHGDPLLNYGDFSRPDHWGHWTLYCQPEGTKVPYTGQGAVLRIKPDGSNLQVVATGLRGPFGLVFDKNWNLFTNDNDHESRPDQYTPARLLHVTPGIDFGWPRGWIASKSPERWDLIEPMISTPGRGVRVGLGYYDDPFFPSEYRHNLLQCRWDRLAIYRYPIEPRGASFTARELPFLEGRQHARPIGVTVGRGGRVFATISYMAGNEASPHYISDLAMITRADDTWGHPFEGVDLTQASLEWVRGASADPSWERRNQAQIELSRRGEKVPTPRGPPSSLDFLSRASVADNAARFYRLAKSTDSYCRQVASRRLALEGWEQARQELKGDLDPAAHLVGALVAGLRLTTPSVHQPPPVGLPLHLPKENAFFKSRIPYADGVLDLPSSGRVGSFTMAEHWKAIMSGPEQRELFEFLMELCKSPHEPARLQAAYFLSLLKDPRSEPLVAGVFREHQEKALAGCPIKTVSRVWICGPWDDGTDGFKPVHPPEVGAIDVGAVYRTPAGDKGWSVLAAGGGAFEVASPLLKAGWSCYVYFRLQSAIRQPAQVTVDYAGALRLVVDGRPVHEKLDAKPRAAVFIMLEPGSNNVLLRLKGGGRLQVHFRCRGEAVATMPEKLGFATLAQRLKEAAGAKDLKIGPEFLIDWQQEAARGDAEQGCKLFGSLGCVKCHAITADQKGGGAPGLTEAGKRFTVPHLVESVLLPSKQVAEPFRATNITTTGGQLLSGLVVSESAESLDLLLLDTTTRTIKKQDIEERTLTTVSPMPAGLVRTPAELRDLLAYMLSNNPMPP